MGTEPYCLRKNLCYSRRLPVFQKKVFLNLGRGWRAAVPTAPMAHRPVDQLAVWPICYLVDPLDNDTRIQCLHYHAKSRPKVSWKFAFSGFRVCSNSCGNLKKAWNFCYFIKDRKFLSEGWLVLQYSTKKLWKLKTVQLLSYVCEWSGSARDGYTWFL